MKSLQTLQKNFQEYLIDIAFDSIIHCTVDSEKLNATRRFQIYHDAYRLRLLEVLEDDYPKLHTLLGDEAFETLGLAYIEAHPSRHFSVRYFGQEVASFLKMNEAYLDYPYLAEMAAFEWHLRGTLDAPTASPIALDYLHHLAPEQWETLQIQFHPSMVTLILEWDVPAIWQAIEKNEPPREPQKQPKAISWVLWRKDLQCHFRSLTEPEALALHSFQEGLTFADVCERLCDILDFDTVPKEALGFLQQCLKDEMICRILPPTIN